MLILFCFGITYEINNRGVPLCTCYSLVCHSVIAAPFVRSLVSLLMIIQNAQMTMSLGVVAEWFKVLSAVPWPLMV